MSNRSEKEGKESLQCVCKFVSTCLDESVILKQSPPVRYHLCLSMCLSVLFVYVLGLLTVQTTVSILNCLFVLSVCPSDCLCLSLSPSICLSVCLCLSVFVSICLSVCLSLSVRLFASVCLSVSVCLHVCVFIYLLFVCPFIVEYTCS